MTPVHPHPAPLLYLITDRHRAASRPGSRTLASLAGFAESAAVAGVGMIQIRERDLSCRDLFELTSKVAKST